MVISLFSFILPSRVIAAAVSWDGGASTANWSDANNWSGDALPTADDDVTINLSTTVNIAATTTINSLTLGQNGGGTTPTLNFTYNAITDGALTIDAGDLIVYSGATATHSTSTSSTVVGSIKIVVVMGDATIAGSVNLNGKGFIYNQGPGKGQGATNAGTGADHGGQGGDGQNMAGTNDTYDSIIEPVLPGSGGLSSAGGAGGGVFYLTVAGDLNLTGSITANGNNISSNYGSGGAGGSIYLSVSGITGAGTITANGGNGDAWGGGGGGGRIAIYTTGASIPMTPTAYGSPTGVKYGGAGTILIRVNGQTYGDLTISNNNTFTTYNHSNSRNYGTTPIAATVSIDSLIIKNYGQLKLESGANITYSSIDWGTKGVIIDRGGTLSLISGGGNLTVPATAYYFADTARTFESITLSGIITHSFNTTEAAGELYKVNLTTTSSLLINSGGSINVTGVGYIGGEGPGNGLGSSRGGGGGYGGAGGSGSQAAGGGTYGSLTTPTNLGSGGSSTGGNGGGVVILNIGGIFTVSSGASIIAKGQDYPTEGGGSGGSVYVISDSFEGSGTISANGGLGNTGSYGGGGGGGRIALYFNSKTFSGTVQALGAFGQNYGQNGTTIQKFLFGELVSTPFDTSDPATLIYDLLWTENLTAGTDGKLQISTAPDNGSGAPGTWSDWYGPGGSGTYYTDPSGGEAIYSGHSDAANDQWFKYKIIFSAAVNDANIPTISDVTLTYIVNTPPTITITNAPLESATGTVAVSYTVSDPEESTVDAYLTADIGLTIGSDYVSGSTSNLALSSASNLPSTGTILIDSEMITYTSKSSDTLTGITRGVNGTTTTTHISGSSAWFVASTSSLSGDYGSISTFGTKNVTWTPANNLTALETATAKIKIIANDGNLANQVGSDFESSIALDTKPPISNDIYLNKYLGRIVLSATDSNGIYYKASNNSDLTSDGINASSGNWTAYSTPATWTFTGDPSTVYVRYKDAYGNETSTVSTVSPTRLSSLMIQDASNPDTSEWRLFISWVTATTPTNGFNYYQVYRSTDGNTFAPLTQVNAQAQNYFLDTGLDSATTYYYRTTIVDDHGNESDANYPIQTSGSSSRSGVGLTPDGSGGGDFTAPNITNIVVSNTTTTAATFTWTTDELSDSTLGYSTNTSYSNEVGSISMGTSHTINLTNLTPNTSYYYRVISADALNNKSTVEDSSTQSFTTLADTTGPVISDIKAVVGETQAGISWSTTEESTSRVEYSVDTSYSEATSSASLDFGHALTLSGLVIDTTYNYRVISVDSSDNSSTSPSYTFTTSAITVADLDATAPSISNISVSDVTAISAKISWSTSEGANGNVEYGESTSYERGIAEGNHEYKTSKSVTVIGLSPETTYHYRITAVDAAGNVGLSGDATFATSVQTNVDLLTGAAISSGANAPSITTAGASVSDITGTTATLSWTTTKKSTSEVYYKIKNSLDAPINTGSTTYLVDHAVTLVGLSPATAYEYQVKSTDVNGNFVSSTKAEFTTTLPGVTAVKVVSKSAIEASISWFTAIPTTTVVEYINTTTKESRKYSNSSLVTSHVADLSNLYPGTVYSFTVLIADEAGNLARSDQYSFTTGEDTVGPSITGVNNRSTIIAGQNKVQTVVTWTTNEPTTSLVEYSLGTGTGNYDQKTRENEDFVQNHIMVISGLKPGSVYRYRVNSKDRADNEGQSEAYVLLTPLKEVSALDLIIKNLQSSFGWLNKL